ncbi:hypothetical protein U1Q18_024234 [Sarracenia purpurea var. burkii]
MQRRRIRVQMMQHPHRNHRRNKHGDGTKNPHQQSGGEVERPDSDRPEITSVDHRLMDVSHRNIGVGHGDEVDGVDKAPRGLHKTSESNEETGEEGDVFDGEDGGGGVAVNKVALEDVFGGGSDPCAD